MMVLSTAPSYLISKVTYHISYQQPTEWNSVATDTLHLITLTDNVHIHSQYDKD